ncbi:MAG TPA: thermonuclease family protein [Candidatus Saccharimonadales bacterium]
MIGVCQYFGLWAKAKKSGEAAQPGLYSINHFIDGDTISVNMNGTAQSIRLIGVDTPETHKPNTPVQCFGEDAAAFTKATIGDSRVRLVADPESDDRDVYGRLVRYVYLQNGLNLDELLIQNGYGFAYLYFPFTKASQFAADQQAAQAQHTGLWRVCHPYQESDGRWQTETAAPT